MRPFDAPSLTIQQLQTQPELVREHLVQTGLLLIDGLADAAQLAALSHSLGSLLIQEDTDQRGVKAVSPEAAMAGSELHTDRASMSDPPPLVWIYCAKQASVGGESVFVDMALVVKALQEEQPELLKALCQPQSVCFGIGELVMMTQLLSCDEQARWVARFRYDRWGFYSPPLIEALPKLWALINAYRCALRLTDGQSYLVQNGRWLHGALPSEGGPRHIYRTMIYPHDESLKLGWREDH